MDYAAFLHTKQRRFKGSGFACDWTRLPASMFEWQKKIVAWATQKGRCAIWADTGLGKTIMQLSWADQVRAYTGKPVLILTPLAVSAQTVKEAEKFGIQAAICHETGGTMIGVTNYHKLHRFDASLYGGVMLSREQVETTISRFLSWHGCAVECDHDLQQVLDTDAAQRQEIERLKQRLAESEQAAYDIAGTIDFLKTENARLTQRVEELEEEF